MNPFIPLNAWTGPLLCHIIGVEYLSLSPREMLNLPFTPGRLLNALRGLGKAPALTRFFEKNPVEGMPNIHVDDNI